MKTSARPQTIRPNCHQMETSWSETIIALLRISTRVIDFGTPQAFASSAYGKTWRTRIDWQSLS